MWRKRNFIDPPPSPEWTRRRICVEHTCRPWTVAPHVFRPRPNVLTTLNVDEKYSDNVTRHCVNNKYASRTRFSFRLVNFFFAQSGPEILLSTPLVFHRVPSKRTDHTRPVLYRRFLRPIKKKTFRIK